MKRFLPFVIIALVAVLTGAIALRVYRSKTRLAAVPPATVAASQSPAEVPEDPTLHVRGPRNAPVTLEIYGDFQCPPCGVVSKGIDELQKQNQGKMRVIFHEFPLEMHAHAMEAALAAEASAVQGKFWEMHDKLYENQPAWSEATNVGSLFESYAESIGLDVARFRADRIAPDVRMRVREDMRAGDKRGIKSTPTVFVNGSQLRAGFTRDELQRKIATTLAERKTS